MASMDATICVNNEGTPYGCIPRSDRGSVIQCQRVGNFPLDSIKGLKPITLPMFDQSHPAITRRGTDVVFIYMFFR